MRQLISEVNMWTTPFNTVSPWQSDQQKQKERLDDQSFLPSFMSSISLLDG